MGSHYFPHHGFRFNFWESLFHPDEAAHARWVTFCRRVLTFTLVAFFIMLFVFL